MTVTAVFGAQWGDEGKGKLIDALIEKEKIHIVGRWNGGDNAGHTVENEFGKLDLHLVPSGISYSGVINVIGNGEAVNLDSLLNEIVELRSKGIGVTPENLILSLRAHLNLPYYRDIERITEEIRGKALGKKIGTTGRGIGIVYTHKADRTGVRVIDLLNDGKSFKENVTMHILKYGLKDVDPDKVFDQQRISLNELMKCLALEDTVYFFRKNSGANILLEGAQGNLLDVDGGTVPYVTSSNPSPGGAYIGDLGIPRINRAICVMKAGYMTRVGSGPFPTELGGKKSEDYCDDKSHILKHELELYEIPFTTDDKGNVKYDHNHQTIMKMMFDEDSFLQGIGIRLAAGEYGVTTGRPRRIGWQDGVAGKYSLDISRGIADKLEIALTKADIPDGWPQIKFCVAYRINGTETTRFPIDETTLYRVEPVYQTYNGWNGTRGIKAYDEAPSNFNFFVKESEKYLEAPVSIISNGPGRKEIIFR